MNQPHEAHDLGLQHDLDVMASRLFDRRRLLGLIACGGASTVLSACGGGSDSGTSTSTVASGSTGGSTATSGSTGSTAGTGSTGATGSSSGSGSSTGTTSSNSCMVDPSETEGPYPADGSNSLRGSTVNVLSQSGVVRSDIRNSFGGFSGTAAGVPLTLNITLVNVNNQCSPLEGYAIYLWHCTREGTYSLYSSDVLSQNFLRGVQATDSKGQCTFVTIFPGCYDGRWPHMHFEVYRSLNTAGSYSNKLLTSQMAMPKDIASAVYTNASGYSASVSNLSRVSIASDNVFGDNTSEQVAWQTPLITGNTTNGYTGTISIGIAV